MKFYSYLFGSEWEESGRALIPQRQQPHYDTLAEQVMANRNEVIALQSEIHRLSQDLTQAMVLNRVLLKLLLEQGVASAEALQMALSDTLQEVYPPLEPGATPSRFCDECGRPFVCLGQKCAYCLEAVLAEPSAEASEVDSDAPTPESEAAEPTEVAEQNVPSESGSDESGSAKRAPRAKKSKKKSS